MPLSSPTPRVSRPPRGAARPLNASEVARLIANGAVPDSVSLLGRLLDDFGAAAPQPLEGAVEVGGGQVELLDLGHAACRAGTSDRPATVAHQLPIGRLVPPAPRPDAARGDAEPGPSRDDRDGRAPRADAEPLGPASRGPAPQLQPLGRLTAQAGLPGSRGLAGTRVPRQSVSNADPRRGIDAASIRVPRQVHRRRLANGGNG